MSDHAYGWLPQLPDPRDFRYTPRPFALGPLPERIDLREDSSMPPVYDQGRLGSCTANAIAGAFEWILGKEMYPQFTPSRLAIYWGERVIEHSTRVDSGAFIRDGFKVIQKRGVAPESEWPYDISKFTRAPSRTFWKHAKKHVATAYTALEVMPTAIQQALVGYDPVVIGFSVFSSFESDQTARTGWVAQPEVSSEQVLGGHAILIVGYFQHNGMLYFVVRNSWGSDWGDKGYCYMPASYIANPQFASDAWCLQVVK